MMEEVQINGKLKTQYIKDLSFEMREPSQIMKTAPESENLKPEVKLDVNVNARKIGEGTGENIGKTLYEVAIQTRAKGCVEEEEIFLVELLYAGIFEIVGADKKAQEKFCLTDAPAWLFPFVSRIISDVTRDGGIMPIRLEPINFNQLYEKSKNQDFETAN